MYTANKYQKRLRTRDHSQRMKLLLTSSLLQTASGEARECDQFVSLRIFREWKTRLLARCVWPLIYVYTGIQTRDTGQSSADFLILVFRKYLVRISVRLPAIMADHCRGFPQYRQRLPGYSFQTDHGRSKLWTPFTSKTKLIWTKITTQKIERSTWPELATASSQNRSISKVTGAIFPSSSPRDTTPRSHNNSTNR